MPRGCLGFGFRTPGLATLPVKAQRKSHFCFQRGWLELLLCESNVCAGSTLSAAEKCNYPKNPPKTPSCISEGAGEGWAHHCALSEHPGEVDQNKSQQEHTNLYYTFLKAPH